MANGTKVKSATSFVMNMLEKTGEELKEEPTATDIWFAEIFLKYIYKLFP